VQRAVLVQVVDGAQRAKGAERVKISTGHTHTHRQRTTPRHRHTHAHDENTTPNEHRPQDLTTLEGGVTTVRATSHARVGGRLAFTRYSFTSKLLSTNQSTFYCPAHLHRPHDCNTLLDYCAIYDPPPRLPFCMPYTIQYWQYQYRVKAKWPRRSQRG